MTTNRLARSDNPSERIIPPTDKEERQRFWIARGNQLLDEQGKQHLEWVCKDGFYFIGDCRG